MIPKENRQKKIESIKNAADGMIKSAENRERFLMPANIPASPSALIGSGQAMAIFTLPTHTISPNKAEKNANAEKNFKVKNTRGRTLLAPPDRRKV